MEMLVATAVVGILAAISVPTYLYYTRKAQYMVIVQAADKYKVAVAACVSRSAGELTQCDGGMREIPPNTDTPFGRVESIVVEDGIITVTPTEGNGIETTDTYILKPIYGNSGITWEVTGGGCNKGLVGTCTPDNS